MPGCSSRAVRRRSGPAHPRRARPAGRTSRAARAPRPSPAARRRGRARASRTARSTAARGTAGRPASAGRSSGSGLNTSPCGWTWSPYTAKSLRPARNVGRPHASTSLDSGKRGRELADPGEQGVVVGVHPGVCHGGLQRRRDRRGKGSVLSMESRVLGRTGRSVGVVGLGCWQLGADWGGVRRGRALAVLGAAVDSGVTFLDTADVYGDGRSEKLIGPFLAAARGPDRTASRSRRRWAAARTRTSPTRTRSTGSAPGPTARARTSTSTPSTWSSCTARRRRCYRRESTYDALDVLVDEGRIAAYGVSVETVDEALEAIIRPHVATRPDHPQRVPPQAARAGAAPAAPRASGSSRACRWRGPAVRQVRRAHAVRRRRPPVLQPRRRGVRRRRDVRRRAVRGRGRGRARGRAT